MRLPSMFLLAALTAMSLSTLVRASESTSGTVRVYEIGKPEFGSCRLKGVDENSENFRTYASVPIADAGVYEGCGRCVQVTCNDDKCTAGKSLVAYVLDVCKGCKSGEVKLSKAALSDLSIDPNDQGVQVSYRMVNCPSSLMSGNVKACLMEGASLSYIPMQIFNAQKEIASVRINGFDAKKHEDSFMFSANTQTNSDTGASDWYSNVDVQMTSTDGEVKGAQFSFGSKSGCTSSNVQFSAASTSGANDNGGEGGGGSGGSSGGGNTAMIAGIVGGIGAVAVLFGSIIFFRRRQAARDSTHDLESNAVRPQGNKPTPPPPVTVVSYDDEKQPPAGQNGGNANEPPTPTTDYSHATSPAAAPSQMPSTAARNAPVPSSLPTDNHLYSTEPSDYQDTQSFSSDASYADEPKYSYSSDMKYSFNSNISSPSRSAPTLPPPIMPAVRESPKNRPAGNNDSELSNRSSFDIDYLRQTEDFSDRSDSFSTAYNSTSYSSGVVTSPQSYVRATALRRTGSGRDTASSHQRNGSIISDSSFGPAQASNPRSSQSVRESGYSRESLNILEYPYARKSGKHSNVTG